MPEGPCVGVLQYSNRRNERTITRQEALSGSWKRGNRTEDVQGRTSTATFPMGSADEVQAQRESESLSSVSELRLLA
jgi:hypothetical protein